MAASASRMEGKPKLPVFKHIIDTRQISGGSSTSAQTLVSDEDILITPRNKLSSAATSIGHCEDLFTQIFLRLPPKSLLRFQCVSKQWRSIISNPDFRRLHSKNFHTCCLLSESDALILFRRTNSEFNFLSFRGENVKLMDSFTARLRSLHFGEILWLHSCNGLLCISVMDSGTREIIVYNPTTSQHTIIPKCEIAEKEYAHGFVTNISFDPLISDHYKIVYIYYDVGDEEYNFVVYSSESKIWKDIEVSVEITNDTVCFANGIQWNGNLHWVSLHKSILCFDLNKESLNWSVPPLPMLGGQWSDCRYFGQSGDCLLAIMVNSSQPMLFHVLNMERDYSAWILKVSIDLNPLSIPYPSMLATEYYPRFHFPYFIWCNTEKRGKLVISMARKIILYDISEKTVEELVDVEPVNPRCSWMDMYSWHHTYTFTMTLASVN